MASASNRSGLIRKLSREEIVATLVLVGVMFASLGLAEAGYTPKPPPAPAWPAIIGVLAFASVWLTTGAHELAHALTATLLTGARVEVHFPTHTARDRFALGKLDFVFDPGTFAHARLPLRSKRWQLALIALAGPVASLAAGAAGVLLARQAVHGSPLAFWGGVILAIEGGVQVFNLVPMRTSWPGSELLGATDGLLLLLALAPRLAARWFSPAELAAEPDAQHPVGLPDGFGEEACVAVGRACSLAQSNGNDHVGTHHLLASLAADTNGVSRLLAKHGIRHADLLRRIPPGPYASDAPAARVRITPALERTLNRARSLRSLSGHATVEPAHVLPGSPSREPRGHVATDRGGR